MSQVSIAGVDMVKFAQPGQNKPYSEMASAAIKGAVEVAGQAMATDTPTSWDKARWAYALLPAGQARPLRHRNQQFT